LQQEARTANREEEDRVVRMGSSSSRAEEEICLRFRLYGRRRARCGGWEAMEDG
jgi:hypothetical protein